MSHSMGIGSSTYVADMLSVNASLTELKIFSNNIGNEGAQAIADALNTNVSSSLKKIVIDDDDHLSAVAAVLRASFFFGGVF